MEIVALALVELHTLDGRPALINPAEITQLITPHPDGEGNKLLVDKVHCVITFSDGRYLSVGDTCTEVLKKLGVKP